MTSSQQSRLALLFLLSLLLLCCSTQEQKRTSLTTFPIRGEIVAIDTVKHRLMISHEAIPNCMDAMTMPFKVKNLDLLKSTRVGDSIQGVLAVSETESWLETFTVISGSDHRAR